MFIKIMCVHEHVVVCTVFLLRKSLHYSLAIHRVVSSLVGQAESPFCPPLLRLHFLLPNYSQLDTDHLSIAQPSCDSSACMDLCLDFAQLARRRSARPAALR